MVEEGRWSSRNDVINSASDRVGSPGDTIHIVVSSWVPGRIILKNLMDRGIKTRCTSVAKLATALPALTISFSRKILLWEGVDQPERRFTFFIPNYTHTHTQYITDPSLEHTH